MHRRAVVAAIACVTLAGLTTACGGSSGSNGGGGGNGGSSSGGGGRGPITYVQGKDNNNILPTIAQMWNSNHPNEKVTIKQQSDSADDQHQDDVQHFQAKDPGYDVVSVDVVWTAEFAAKGWLTPLKGQYALDTSALFQPTVKSATYNGTMYAGPASSDGGLLYYRKDLLGGKQPPTTWQDMYSDCSIAKQNNIDCYGGQYAQYEGLVVNTAEAINTAGGEVVNSQGQPEVTSQQAKNGMNLLVTGFQKGYIPKDALTWQEEQSLNDFESGHLLFMRNWPYAFSLLSTDAKSAVKGKFGVTTLPGDQQDPQGKMPGVSSLGGHNIAISAYSKHKATALDFIKFYESEATQKLLLQKASLAPVRTSLYDDSSLQQQFPYLSTLKTVITNAQPRPVTPFYPAVSQAIEQNAYAILQGQKSVDQGLSDLQQAISAASK